MPQNAFFLQTCDLLVSKKTMQRHFFSTLHPLSTVIFANAAVLAFVLIRDSRFNFHCYTQREATPTQKSARKLRCDGSRLTRKITKHIHSSKPASLNRPIAPPPPLLLLQPALLSCREALVKLSHMDKGRKERRRKKSLRSNGTESVACVPPEWFFWGVSFLIVHV